MIRHEVRPVLFTVEMAEQFSAAAVRCGKEAWFHTAVDTGMSRIGFPDTWESIEEIRKIAKLPKLRLEGIFTHFAKADETDKTSANIQSGRFLNFCETLKKKLPEGLLCHCANSAAIIDLPDTHMDLVRAGISNYGIYPSEEVKKELVPLAPAMEIKQLVKSRHVFPPFSLVCCVTAYILSRNIKDIPLGPRFTRHRPEAPPQRRPQKCRRPCQARPWWQP